MLTVKKRGKSWFPPWFIEWMVVSFLKIRSTEGRLDGRGREDR